MILITAGTVHYPFPRLIETSYVFFSQQKHLNEKVIIQTGNHHIRSKAKASPLLELYDYLSFPQMVEHYKTASLIISSAGEASAHLLLHYSRFQPVLFPRNPLYEEHVDDQQLQIAQVLKLKHLTQAVFSETELTGLLTNFLTRNWKPELMNQKALNQETNKITSFLESVTNS